MADYPKTAHMDSDALNSFGEVCESEEMGTQKISVSDQTNIKSDSFIVDMERFSNITDKDKTANSRITRNLSRKGSPRSGEKKKNSTATNDKDITLVAMSSPRAALNGASISTPEKSMVVTVGSTDRSVNPQLHHQITIVTNNIGGTTPTESKWGGRRFSFRRSSPSWAIDPRKILLFFATMSSMGTLVLIYFILSMNKLSEDDNPQYR
ncbi:uncharacterized protein LOC132266886 isoform X2 [Cornus florida]|uniref:uncharacterized protein LOC132266886 isoform X2 n=1 Tax=Cornus florida TaxID=4283 RepID=UPI002899C836|nr:uncharacterized protein LOC132266886 isoform X2 [Cornus florida]